MLRASNPAAVWSRSNCNDGVSAGSANKRRTAIQIAFRIACGSPRSPGTVPVVSRSVKIRGRQPRTRVASSIASGASSRWSATERQAASAAKKRSVAARSSRGRNGIADISPDAWSITESSAATRWIIDRRAVRDAACTGPTRLSAWMSPARISAEMSVSIVAKRRRASPKSVMVSTRPAQTMPMPISVPRATARLKASPLAPPTNPSSPPAMIAAV